MILSSEAGIIGSIMISQWRMFNGIKIIASAYIAFLREHLESWLKKLRIIFRKTILLLEDSVPSNAVHNTIQ